MRILVFAFIITSVWAQTNVIDTGTRNAAGAQIIPPTSTFASPPSSPLTGAVWIFTDASATGTCAGSGTARATCRWNGSAWEATGGGGGGTPAGSVGAIQYNNTVFGGQAFVIGGSLQRGNECKNATTSYTALTTVGLTQSITLATGISGTFRWDHITLQEYTQAAASGLTSLVGCIGTNTSTCDLVPAFSLAQATAPQNFWIENPTPPILGSGTYTVYLNFTSVGANLNTLSAGSFNTELCGYAVN